ncbi:MAG: hypothetical protein IPI34_10510 [bacterium]|nr:hypothetical protein [bacterium]
MNWLQSRSRAFDDPGGLALGGHDVGLEIRVQQRGRQRILAPLRGVQFAAAAAAPLHHAADEAGQIALAPGDVVRQDQAQPLSRDRHEAAPRRLQGQDLQQPARGPVGHALHADQLRRAAAGLQRGGAVVDAVPDGQRQRRLGALPQREHIESRRPARRQERQQDGGDDRRGAPRVSV